MAIPRPARLRQAHGELRPGEAVEVVAFPKLVLQLVAAQKCCAELPGVSKVRPARPEAQNWQDGDKGGNYPAGAVADPGVAIAVVVWFIFDEGAPLTDWCMSMETTTARVASRLLTFAAWAR